MNLTQTITWHDAKREKPSPNTAIILHFKRRLRRRAAVAVVGQYGDLVSMSDFHPNDVAYWAELPKHPEL